jgi:hypothetical protein
MGVGGRGVGCRQTRRSSAGRHGAEQAGALVGEATGGGVRGARRWWGGARHSRKRCSPVGEAWGGGGRGVMSGSARSGDTGLGCMGLGVARSIGRREVGRVARDQTGGVGGAHARGRSVGRAGFGWSVGPLGPDDRSMVLGDE